MAVWWFPRVLWVDFPFCAPIPQELASLNREFQGSSQVSSSVSYTVDAPSVIVDADDEAIIRGGRVVIGNDGPVTGAVVDIGLVLL